PATWDHPAVPLLLGDARPPEASPLAQLPLGSPAILVHGTADEVVPFDQSKRYAEAAGAELVPLEGAGHFEPIDPQSREWTAVRDAIRTLAAGGHGAGSQLRLWAVRSLRRDRDGRR